MKVRVQVVIETDDGTAAVHEVAQLDREVLQIDTLGLHLAEAKDLLRQVQEVLIDEPVRTGLTQQVACRTVGGRGGTRTPPPSWCARSSARCACPVPAGSTAPASRSRHAPLARWLHSCPSGPRPNSSTWKASSPV